jgi:hypothetical protein
LVKEKKMGGSWSLKSIKKYTPTTQLPFLKQWI